MSIAKTNVISGSTAPFGTGVHDPYLDGNVLVLSKIDKELFKPEHSYVEIANDAGDKKGGYISDIGAIVLNTHLYAFYDDLKTMFPDVNIIKASDLAEYVSVEVAEKENSK